MDNTEEIELGFTGEYSLAASVLLAARAWFVDEANGSAAEKLDLAFVLEGAWKPVGVRISQLGIDVLRAEILANPQGADVRDIQACLRRILSLDVDGRRFAQAVAGDRVASKLRALHPGIRPILFPSPYEAAARAIIGQRLPARQAAVVSRRLAATHGTGIDLSGRVASTFPSPARLAALPAVQGLAERKVAQLRSLGRAAAEGRLDSARLRAMPRETALLHLQELPGIGPFSAELILLRGIGDADAFPKTEPNLHRGIATAYGLGSEPGLAAVERVADGWKPFRGWMGLLLRNFAPEAAT